MNLLLKNGLIYTMDHATDVYSEILIKDGLIHSVGENLITEETTVIDLEGKIVIPGFNDSHMHLLGLGASLSQVDLSSARSIDDVIKMTQVFISDHNLQKNTWVVGRGWNQDLFENRQMPSAEDLDQISNEHYIFLRRACGHVATCNTHLLHTFNFSRKKIIIDGGMYENGIFKENALELVSAKMPVPTKKDLKQWIQTAAHYVNSLGITSVQSDDLCVFSEDLVTDIFSSFIELDMQKELSVRVYEQSLFRSKANLINEINQGYVQNKGSDHFKMGPLKILGDGSLGGRTAWLNKPYADAPSETGIHMYEQDELNEYVYVAHQSDTASAIHCIGDRMLDSALDAINYAQTKLNKPKLRHGIVHCQITSKEQLERMKILNVMAYVQPIFLDYDAHIVNDRVGDLADTSYNWKTMMDLGLRMSFGSDAPVDSADPIQGIHCAVTRKGLNNTPADGYLPEQAMSVYDAIYNYTVESAYASCEEDKKGKLLPGYFADMVVLEGNIFEDILGTQIHTTIVNGDVVYQR
jgi:predicted amidohydrolase YtcJ